ncbi:hypothetical protein AB1Y20_016775 [Prymnesium parvum]|uniref:Prolyl 4-hydroxylase alpha subunit domain-containing protein n=1 Tax=Prymnesium parvum TaxID=97485 RepID=A0AB34IAP3_PRYPA
MAWLAITAETMRSTPPTQPLTDILARSVPPKMSLLHGRPLSAPQSARPAPVLSELSAVRAGALDPAASAWLGGWWRRRDTRAAMASQLSRGVVQVHDFLAHDVAIALANEMNDCIGEGFQSRFHWLPNPLPSDKFPMLRAMHSLFGSQEMRAWAEALLGHGVQLDTITSMGTLYNPGDYTTVHSDTIHSSDGSRRLAFVLHLSRDWLPEWGGDMVFLNPYVATHPSFNRMTFFVVGDTRHQHMVTPVASTVPARARRLAFVGWFYSPTDDLADVREEVWKQRRISQEQFVLTVNGEDGRWYPGQYD